MLYLLDTDHLSVMQRIGAEADRLKERLKHIAPDDYGTTIISYKEQIEGRLAELKQAEKLRSETAALEQLHRNLRFYLNISVWDYTDEAQTIYRGLLRLKVNAGAQDLKIAAIAPANNATVLTRNTQHFSRVPGLRVEDWTA